MKNHKSATFVAQAAVIAALYVILTYIASMMGIANGVIQVRFSEMMCILPIFTPAAVPGLFIGCIISNTISGCVIWDIIFGSLATLIGAVGTMLLRKVTFRSVPILSFIPPILANAIVVPFVLAYAYGVEDAIWFMILTVGAGELISVAVFGGILYAALRKYRSAVFKPDLYTK